MEYNGRDASGDNIDDLFKDIKMPNIHKEDLKDSAVFS